MGQLITNPKTYTGQEMENIFFLSSYTGDNAKALGLKCIFNLPVNTTMNLFERNDNILQDFADGWQGGDASTKKQKTIEFKTVKAEMGIKATTYKNTIFMRMANTAGVNMQDLQGTDVEQAEVSLFREAIAEATRVHMWAGDTAAAISSTHTKFDGFLKKASTYAAVKKMKISATTASNVVTTFESILKAAPAELKARKGIGNLAFFVTDDVYEAYESALDANTLAYNDMQNGRQFLNYHGIEVRRMGVDGAFKTKGQSTILFTDKDNLLFSVNTKDMPDAEVRFWYNPDENENRNRAVFSVATEILDDELVVYASTTYAAS